MNKCTVLLLVAFVCLETAGIVLPLSSTPALSSTGLSEAALWAGIALFAVGFFALAVVVMRLVVRTMFPSLGEAQQQGSGARRGGLLEFLLAVPRQMVRSDWSKVVVGAVLLVLGRVVMQGVDDLLLSSLLGLLVMNAAAVLLALGIGPAMNAVLLREVRS